MSSNLPRMRRTFAFSCSFLAAAAAASPVSLEPDFDFDFVPVPASVPPSLPATLPAELLAVGVAETSLRDAPNVPSKLRTAVPDCPSTLMVSTSESTLSRRTVLLLSASARMTLIWP